MHLRLSKRRYKICFRSYGIVYVIILAVTYEVNTLVRIPLPVDNEIITTEIAIRKTINKIFGNLNYHNKTKRIVESNLVHNFFTSLTLQDYNTLLNVDSVSRTPIKTSNTTDYVGVINEILNDNIEANKTDETYDFTPKIEEILKLISEYNAEMKTKSGSLDINEEILKHLKRDKLNEANNSTENNSLLSDNEFWEPSGRRIYRGKMTKIKYFPFMAVIQFFGKFTCAGSIIKSDLIISAASCLQLAYNNRFFRENPSFLSVRVGSTFYNGGGEVIPVLEVYFHPRYNPKTLQHNLCLLRLQRRLKFRKRSKQIKKIDFDRSESHLSMTTGDITVVGWGATDSSNKIREPWRNRIAFANLDVYHFKECQELYSDEYVTKYNFCAGFISKGGGACNQDVGGPGVVDGKLTGVISFGSPVCGRPDAPTVFTKVGFYSDWIEEILEQDVPHANKRTTLRVPYILTLPTVLPLSSTTKFKISPLGKQKKMSPVPLPSQYLRNEDDVFRDFLKTMFGSKEVNAYMEQERTNNVVGKMMEHFHKTEDNDDRLEKHDEIIADGDIQDLVKRNKKHKKVKSGMYAELEGYDVDANDFTKPIIKYPADEIPNKGTELYIEAGIDDEENLDSEKSSQIDTGTPQANSAVEEVLETSTEVTENPGKYTVIDEALLQNEEKELENDIVKLIDNVQLDKLIEEAERPDHNNKYNMDLKSNKKNNKFNETVMTLLYLSDKEKKNSEENDGDIDGDGLSIPMGNFKDFTYRNNGSKLLDIMEEEDIFDLLSEAIKNEELNNKVHNN